MLVRKRGEFKLIASYKSKNYFIKTKYFQENSNNKCRARAGIRFPEAFMAGLRALYV